MRFHHFVSLLALLGALQPPLGARTKIGGFGGWAAFCDEPRRCFAISQPYERRSGAFLRVAVIGRGLELLVHVGRPVREATLRVGDRRFRLMPSGENARADAATSRRIVAAIRDGETLTVFGASTGGGRYRHHYQLAGAPSAIDAATLAAVR